MRRRTPDLITHLGRGRVAPGGAAPPAPQAPLS